jgi:tetratricopeptide (TPR) repeat protein
VAVEPQVFDLLVYLIRHRERVVSRNDLLASVWQGRLVSESALNTRIHLARSAVGDSGETQRLIKTFPRKGIRFVAPVREDRGMTPHGVLTMLAAPTIALLPFTTVRSPELSRAPGSTFEVELRSELDRTHRGFDLIIRSTADDRDRRLSPQPAGSRSDARYLVVGTLWLDGEVRRANVQLIEAETDRQIWSEPFELKPGQQGAGNRLAARIARLIIIQVRTAESRRPLPGNVEAGHYVLQGRALHETERGAKSTSEAQALFNRALQLDPNSVPALQGLAATRLIQLHNMWISQEQRSAALIEADVAIERLVMLDPGNASGHFLRASLLRALGDIDKAIASAQHALCLNPNYYAAHAELGRLKIEAGEAHEAMSHIQEAIELIPPEPNVHVLYFWAGLVALHVSDDRAAVLWLLKARQTNPAFSPSPLYLAAAYLGIGEEERARASLAEFLKITPGFSLATWRQWFPVPNATVAKQRQRIRDAWHRLGVPDDETRVPEQ